MELVMSKPVAWMYNDEIIYSNSTVKKMLNGSNGLTPLYKKQEWQGLSYDDIDEIVLLPESWGEMLKYVKAIENALKEKNHG
jgi:hypothetical protein